MTDPPVTALPTREPDPVDPLAEALHLAVATKRIAERLGERGQRPRERTYATKAGPGAILRIPLPGVEGALTYFIERAEDAWVLLADPSDTDAPTPFARRTARRFPSGVFGLRQIEAVVLAETR